MSYIRVMNLKHLLTIITAISTVTFSSISLKAEAPYDINALPSTLSLNDLDFTISSFSLPLNGDYNFSGSLTGLGGSFQEKRYTNSIGNLLRIRLLRTGPMELIIQTQDARYFDMPPGEMDHSVMVQVTYVSPDRDFNNLTPTNAMYYDNVLYPEGTQSLGYALGEIPQNLATNFANGIGEDGNLVGGLPVTSSTTDEAGTVDVWIDRATELNVGLRFQDGQWVVE